MKEIITTVLGLAVVGVILWFIEAHVPMNPAIKTLITIVVIIAVIFYLLNRFLY